MPGCYPSAFIYYKIPRRLNWIQSSPPASSGSFSAGGSRVRLTPDIALVGSGAFGFDLTSPGDCHVYLIDGGDELALVDAGCGGAIGDTELILRTARADGFDLDKVSRLLLTHYHFDHMGGAAEMREK